MLSILIPTYNYDCTNLVEQLKEELDFLPLTYEIVVFEDSSTVSEIVSANKSIAGIPNCIYRYQEKNLGRTATRHALAEAATYNWLLFMDADVLPKNIDFIRKFEIETQSNEVVFGGITYETKKPEKDKMLRWKYGKSREAKSVEEREKLPYLSIISGCILIQKDIFLRANTMYENLYGGDVVFCRELQKMKAAVKHIDNPVIHLGLESNPSFIEKTKKGLESLYFFEKEEIVPNDYRPIQKAYQALKKNGALKLFRGVVGFFENSLLKNLKSSSPSLFLFDLYRLYYYAKLQSKNLEHQTLNPK